LKIRRAIALSRFTGASLQPSIFGIFSGNSRRLLEIFLELAQGFLGVFSAFHSFFEILLELRGRLGPAEFSPYLAAIFRSCLPQPTVV